ncbi:MAG TPA: hypothetical protein VFW89_00085 [Gemmatimonadaceae bacterium]|nr:hypothetical protein [Gemmatimonadaceae bacterium]
MEHDDIGRRTHDPHHDLPRGGPWAICIAISVALVVAVAIAPQRWKMPLGVASMVALVLGVGMLLLSAGPKRDVGPSTAGESGSPINGVRVD